LPPPGPPPPESKILGVNNPWGAAPVNGPPCFQVSTLQQAGSRLGPGLPSALALGAGGFAVPVLLIGPLGAAPQIRDPSPNTCRNDLEPSNPPFNRGASDSTAGRQRERRAEQKPSKPKPAPPPGPAVSDFPKSFVSPSPPGLTSPRTVQKRKAFVPHPLGWAVWEFPFFFFLFFFCSSGRTSIRSGSSTSACSPR